MKNQKAPLSPEDGQSKKDDFWEFRLRAPFYLGQPFTEDDRQLLALVASMLPGLAAIMGAHCEVVLNSIEDPEHSVIASYNASVSGRVVGTAITPHGLRVMKGVLDKGSTHLSHFPRGPKGQRIKSAIIPLVNKHGRCLGSLSIGINLEVPLADFMQEVYPLASDDGQKNAMVFGSSPAKLIEEYVTRFQNEANFDKKLKKRERVKFIVQQLEQHDIFQLRDAVVEVSRQLGLNPGTVYMHLRELKKNNT